MGLKRLRQRNTTKIDRLLDKLEEKNVISKKEKEDIKKDVRDDDKLLNK